MSKEVINQFCTFYEDVSGNKGYIFDFDDTLAKTPAQVHVVKNGQRSQSLSPSIFNTYKLKDGETFDFSDFDDPKIIRMAKKFKIWKVLKNVEQAVGDGRTDSKMYILTARSKDVRDALHEFLVSNGIKTIGRDDIYTVGDSGSTPHEDRDTRSIAERKKEVLGQLREKHSGDVIFFDDDQKNIDLALEVPGIKTRLVKEELEESILDEPRKTMAPEIWDTDTNELVMKSNIHDAVLDGLITLVGDVPIDQVYVVGSLTGTRYNPDADLDVSVIVDADDETHKHLQKRAGKLNGKFAPGTEHPINYFVMNKDVGTDRFDSVYDFKDDKWIKPPKDHGVDLFNVYDEFRQYIKDVDVERDEALRSLIDIEILLSAIQTGGDSKIIFDKILQRFKALDYSVKDLAEKYDDVHKERVQAFLDYEGGDRKGLPSPNMLPENIRYKLLERYHYLDFMHKLVDLVDTTGDIDTLADMEAVRKIISESASDTCDEYRLGGFRNHDEADVVDGRKFFETSLKRWNDKATGKVKSGAKPKDSKSDLVEEIIQEASFGIDTYKVPREDRQQMMMDFYFLTGIYQSIPDIASGDLATDLQSAVDFALNKIVDFVQEDLGAATFFSICAEMRHVFDRNEVENLMTLIEKDTQGNQTITVKTVKADSPDFKLNIPYDVSDTEKFQKIFKKYVIGYAALDKYDLGPGDNRLERYGDFGIQSGSSKSYINSWKAAKNSSKGDNVSFAELSKFFYLKAKWNSSYGGDAWAGIAHFYIEVAESKTLKEKIENIDKLFSLQHNTGTVLNKVKEYAKDGNFNWIKKALDFKFDARSYWEYRDQVSDGLKKLVRAASKSVEGSSASEKDKDKENWKTHPALQDLNVGDEVRHEDLGSVKGIKVVKILKTKDKDRGQLVKLKNPESGKTFNAFADKLEKIKSEGPTPKNIDTSKPVDWTKIDIYDEYIFNGEEYSVSAQMIARTVSGQHVVYISYDRLAGVELTVTNMNTTHIIEVLFTYEGRDLSAGGFRKKGFAEIINHKKSEDSSTDSSDGLTIKDNKGNSVGIGSVVKFLSWHTDQIVVVGKTAKIESIRQSNPGHNKFIIIFKPIDRIRDDEGGPDIDRLTIIDHPSETQQFEVVKEKESIDDKIKSYDMYGNELKIGDLIILPESQHIDEKFGGKKFAKQKTDIKGKVDFNTLVVNPKGYNPTAGSTGFIVPANKCQLVGGKKTEPKGDGFYIFNGKPNGPKNFLSANNDNIPFKDLVGVPVVKKGDLITFGYNGERYKASGFPASSFNFLDHVKSGKYNDGISDEQYIDPTNLEKAKPEDLVTGESFVFTGQKYVDITNMYTKSKTIPYEQLKGQLVTITDVNPEGVGIKFTKDGMVHYASGFDKEHIAKIIKKSPEEITLDEPKEKLPDGDYIFNGKINGQKTTIYTDDDVYILYSQLDGYPAKVKDNYIEFDFNGHTYHAYLGGFSKSNFEFLTPKDKDTHIPDTDVTPAGVKKSDIQGHPLELVDYDEDLRETGVSWIDGYGVYGGSRFKVLADNGNYSAIDVGNNGFVRLGVVNDTLYIQFFSDRVTDSALQTTANFVKNVFDGDYKNAHSVMMTYGVSGSAPKHEKIKSPKEFSNHPVVKSVMVGEREDDGKLEHVKQSKDERTEYSLFSQLKKGDKVKVVKWMHKDSPVLGSIGTWTGESRNIKFDGKRGISYKIKLDHPVHLPGKDGDSDIIYVTQYHYQLGSDTTSQVLLIDENPHKYFLGDKVVVVDPPESKKAIKGKVGEVLKAIDMKNYKTGVVSQSLNVKVGQHNHLMSSKLVKPYISPVDEDVNEEIANLGVCEDLEEYFMALEGIMNKFEITGGKAKLIKTAGQVGKRVDRGSKGALNSRQMSGREQMKRKIGAIKSNIKTKAKGKLASANKKKVIGQKLNPNSPTGKF